MRDWLFKAAGVVLALGVAGCSGGGIQSVPASGRTTSAVGPALQAPTLRRPQDVLGGPTGLLFGTLNTLLGDGAPVLNGEPMTHFYVGVREVDAIANGQTTVLGTAATPVQVDLLQYQNGSTEWMTQTSVPAQAYSQLRYVFDLSSAQAVFADGSTMPVSISTASSQSSDGIGASTSTASDSSYANTVDVTVNAPLSIQTGTSSAAADFNLGESLSVSNGSVILRPTIAAASSAGSITGTVENASGSAVSNATIVAFGSNGTAVNSATTDAKGYFHINALPADTYQLVVNNRYINAAGYQINASGQSSWRSAFYGPSVTVTSGSSASAGTIGD